MVRFFSVLLLLTTICQLQAQDTLPRFNLVNAGNNRIIIGWVNPYPNVKQISIQRSFDSLSGYKSILTVADPMSPQNGYVDMKATNDHMFYRIYIMLEGGSFLFSQAKKPVIDSSRKFDMPPNNIRPGVDSLKVGTSPVRQRPPGFIPSLYVYTNRDGYVRVNLPNSEKPKKYAIKFFDDNNRLLFELKDVKEKEFKIDKTNFYHAGWFYFELYEDEALFEKHKFYLDKDF